MKRRLEIGPGKKTIRGFERLGIDEATKADYLCDASEPLPFADNTFNVVFASHILEHIPWYKTLQTLKEWVRITSLEGQLEIWVPNGILICETILDAEYKQVKRSPERIALTKSRDPYLWANWRLYTYPHKEAENKLAELHKAMFTPKSLTSLMLAAGCKKVWKLNKTRGYNHGFVNMGFGGKK